MINPRDDIDFQIDQIVLILARGASTPVTYWLDQSLGELGAWLKAASSLAR